MGKRFRYYQSIIDSDILRTGESYASLKDSYIIFLCTFDPFKLERPIYTFESICTDDAESKVSCALKLETGAKIVVCNACAYDKTSADMRDLFEYLTTHKIERKNTFVEKIDEAVQIANNNKKVRDRAMIADFKIEDARYEGIVIWIGQVF